jgi:L-lactate utilization protein LutC
MGKADNAQPRTTLTPNPSPADRGRGEPSIFVPSPALAGEGGPLGPGEGSSEALLTTFTTRAEAVGIRVDRVASGEDAAAWLSNIRSELEVPALSISSELVDAAPALIAALDAAGIAWSSPADPTEARDVPLGVSLAKLAVAETGSVLLAEETLAARSVGLLSLANVVICRTGDLVETLEEAAAALKEIAIRPGGGCATLVTGPSRTADIELSLTIGVQGPARVFVLFVDNLS